MNFSEAQQEFQVRYYLWAASEWEKEINESLPNLRSFKSGTIWETYHFMQLLNKTEQLKLACGFLKRFHPEAVKKLGEKCSPEEETLRSRRDDFFRIRGFYEAFKHWSNNGQTAEASSLFQLFRDDACKVLGETYFDDDTLLLSKIADVFQPIGATLEEQIAARRKAGEKIKFVSKRTLQKTLAERFKSAFNNQCGDFRFDDSLDPWSAFDMSCCGWTLSTHFWFGRRESLINYHHNISSPTKIYHPEHPEITAPAMSMGQMISFSSWLGLTSQIQWEYLFNDDVDSACDVVFKHCRYFFEVAPKLLKGLEFENITAN
jgi:hypothetical protein